KHTVLIR
ncbi:carboxynorspermidine decarboxylase, partial [Vibrio parahaemolyticus V-223/04]